MAVASNGAHMGEFSGRRTSGRADGGIRREEDEWEGGWFGFAAANVQVEGTMLELF
jgi:hypothetical protein